MMSEQTYEYAIVGAGLAGASAIEGIRERDTSGRIMLLGVEKHLPYHRPPLSKQLWLGKKKVEDIFIHEEKFYTDNGVSLALGSEIIGLDAGNRTIRDSEGNKYRYQKLLLATGGYPRRLEIPGSDLDGICYFRNLDDYLTVRALAAQGKSAVVIGGGFIGSEMAAALNMNGVDVTMVFPEPYLVQRVFPESLGRAIQSHYLERGIKIISGDVPASFEKKDNELIVSTRNGERIEASIVIVGIGIVPSTSLAEKAGLECENGIVANEYLQTSNPDIYVAGDNSFFPYQALEQHIRIEHWDNALNQGKQAGRNMAGASEPFTYMPFFFSDLFEFGYEAVGEVNTKLDTFDDWQKENETGVLYYLKDGKVRGAMMCNVWDKVDAARELIRKGERVTPEDLRGAIR
jgi:NADPH-dependent 2,4-dienoyl-CoA reductase/sulfur reductase-like enzyme